MMRAPVRRASSHPAWSSSASAYSNPLGVTRPTGRSRNMTASVMVWLKRFMNAWWLSADS